MTTMNKNQPPLTGEATAEQIATWKKEHPQGIYRLTGEGHVGYFKNPTLAHVNHAYSKQDGSKVTEMWKALGESTFVGGSDKLLTDDTLFLGIQEHLQAKAGGAKVELVNL